MEYTQGTKDPTSTGKELWWSLSVCVQNITAVDRAGGESKRWTAMPVLPPKPPTHAAELTLHRKIRDLESERQQQATNDVMPTPSVGSP